MTAEDFLALTTFLRLGEKKCPRCGMIGEKIILGKGRDSVSCLRCPGCETKFTSEIIINLGEDEREIMKHN